RYDDQVINPEKEKIVILLHKPRGVITTAKDTHDRKTVLDLIPGPARLVPVGRLDKNTTGALLLSNDGNLHEYLTHPRNQIPKDYEAVIEGRITPEQIAKLKRGIYIGDREYGQAEVLKQNMVKQRSTVRLRLRQGKKREIRRIMHRLKRKLFSLKRIRFAGLGLGDLVPGQYRTITAEEIQMLKKSHLSS
nr:pseudouridine synthase [Candidatus Neomarinimicrobiota bacterium]